jgi:hypothetical protein
VCLLRSTNSVHMFSSVHHLPSPPTLHTPNSSLPQHLTFLTSQSFTLLPAYVHQKDERALPGNLRSSKLYLPHPRLSVMTLHPPIAIFSSSHPTLVYSTMYNRHRPSVSPTLNSHRALSHFSFNMYLRIFQHQTCSRTRGHAQ